MTIETGLALGVVVDALAGDPRRGHPVAGFGRVAAALERRLHRDSRARGVAFTTVCVLGTAGLGALADALVRRASARPTRRAYAPPPSAPSWPPVSASTPLAQRRIAVFAPTTLLTAAATWAVLGGTSLVREGMAMAAALEAGDLGAARDRLPHLCGRDPSALDGTELARATVESIAENTSDAVVAPLLWGALLGVPGLLAYRAVNTLDAMVGHRDARNANFGWAAARLDDAVNWAPARLTGLLTVAFAPLAGGSTSAAYAILRRDGAAHPSPNAGRCEAAFAGALGVRLGGVNVYGDRVEHRPELGDGRAPEATDIQRAARLSRAVTVAALVLAYGGRVAIRRAVTRARGAGLLPSPA